MNPKQKFLDSIPVLGRLAGRKTSEGSQPTKPVSDEELSSICFVGPFADWESARQASSGYDAPQILAKARDALLKVKRGEAAFERDTVVMDRVEYSYPVIAGLLHASTHAPAGLTVLDFGGSLGSAYFQNRAYLSALRPLHWCVVEQSHFVACGREVFEDEQLHFFDSIASCLELHRPDVVLLSGVVEYLPEPVAFLQELAGFGIRCILFDRTPVVTDRVSQLMVQRVPPSIYEASYPCWLLNRSDILAPFLPAYDLVDEFDSGVESALLAAGIRARFSGFLLRLRG